MRKILEGWNKGECFEVWLLPLSLPFDVGQHTLKQANETARFRRGCGKHAEMKLVVSNDVNR